MSAFGVRQALGTKGATTRLLGFLNKAIDGGDTVWL